MSQVQSFSVFALVLSVLIVVHEWGHFITAKKLGVRVERFSVGFGPKLFSWLFRGTEFLICLIPLGGYVKMAGDERAQCKGTKDEFYSQAPGHRALIVLNGPVVNFISAYACLVLVFMIGYPDLSNKIGKVLEGYPAQEAGLKVDDEIIKIDANKVESWTDVQQNIAQASRDTINITVVRKGQKLELVVSARVEEQKNIFGQMASKRLVGIQPKEEIISLRYDLGSSLVKGGQKLWEITYLTYKSLYHMITGSMSAKESMTGPIGIFFIIKSAAEMGLNHLIYIVGLISASLAIFNLLPVIPLDGGHLFLLAIERLRGKALSQKTDELIARVGFSLIICLALFVFYSDFARLGWIDKIKQLIP